MSNAPDSNAHEPDALVLIYDGECPVCSRYVRMLRLREAVGEVTLLDARGDDALVREMAGKGIDLDAGMVLMYAQRLYHGSDCLHMLALLSSPSGTWNRLNAWLFRSATLSRIAYPLLRGGRNLLLRMLGRPRIHRTLS